MAEAKEQRGTAAIRAMFTEEEWKEVEKRAKKQRDELGISISPDVINLLMIPLEDETEKMSKEELKKWVDDLRIRLMNQPKERGGLAYCP